MPSCLCAQSLCQPRASSSPERANARMRQQDVASDLTPAGPPSRCSPGRTPHPTARTPGLILMDQCCFLEGKAVQEGQGFAPPPAQPLVPAFMAPSSVHPWTSGATLCTGSCIAPRSTLPHPADHLLGTSYLPDHPSETLKTFPPQSFHRNPEQGSPGSSGPPLGVLRAWLESWLVRSSSWVSRPKRGWSAFPSSANSEMSLLGKCYYQSNTGLL